MGRVQDAQMEVCHQLTSNSTSQIWTKMLVKVFIKGVLK
jgi:hypothetical protein